MQVARRQPPTVLRATTTVQRVLGDMTLPGFQFTDAAGAPLDFETIYPEDDAEVELHAARLLPVQDEVVLLGELVDGQSGWVGCDWNAFFIQAGTYQLQYVISNDSASFASPCIFVEVVDLGEHPISTLGEP